MGIKNKFSYIMTNWLNMVTYILETIARIHAHCILVMLGILMILRR
jgi:hypothetical protein